MSPGIYIVNRCSVCFVRYLEKSSLFFSLDLAKAIVFVPLHADRFWLCENEEKNDEGL